MKLFSVIFLVFILLFPIVLMQVVSNSGVEMVENDSDNEEESIPFEENESESNNIEEEVVFLNLEVEKIILKSDKFIRSIVCSLFYKKIYIDIKTPPPLF